MKSYHAGTFEVTEGVREFVLDRPGLDNIYTLDEC